MTIERYKSFARKHQHIVHYATVAAYYDRVPNDNRSIVEAVRSVSFDIIGDQPLGAVIGFDASDEIVERDLTLSDEWLSDSSGSLRSFAVRSAERPPGASKLDLLWSLTYHSDAISIIVRGRPYLSVTFCASLLNDEQGDRLDAAIDRLVEACFDRGNTPYCLVDVGDPLDTGYGFHYCPVLQSPLRLSRQIEKHLWATAGMAQIEKVRGVFWGNVFGPKTVEKLGGAETLIDGFVRSIGEDLSDLWQRDKVTAVLPDGSVYLKLWPELSTMYLAGGVGAGDPPVQRAAWLYQRLADAKLLIGM